MVLETVQAWAWSESADGMAVLGADPPALLVEAVAFYRMEREAVKAEERRVRREQAEMDGQLAEAARRNR